MLTEVKNQFRVTFLSVKYALQREMLNKVTFISNIIFMILNNASFIIQWIILYSLKDNVGGYTFKQVILLWGLAASTFGFSHFFFKEAYNLSDTINKGKLDVFILQPKNTLISCITSSVDISALGDILYGFIMLLIYGITPTSFLLFTLFSITGSAILTAVAVIFSSLSFWFGRVDLIANTANNLMVNFATYPEGIFKGFIKVLFYTIIPIGFVNYIPIQLITSFNPISLILVIAVTFFLILVAFLVFYKGLKNYSSSNLMNART